MGHNGHDGKALTPSQKIKIITEALLYGLEVTLGEETYALGENLEILLKGSRINLGEDGEESLVWLRINPLTDTSAFFKTCCNVSDDDVFLIAGNLALNKINQKEE